MIKTDCIQTGEPFVSCHASSLCELPCGDLLTCCFAGKALEEGLPGQVILGARFDRRRSRWSDPEIWVDVPNHAAGNPRVFLGPAVGEVWLVAPITYGEWCSGGSLLFFKRSYDEGRSWTDLELLWEERGILGKNKPLVEESFCLLPVEREAEWSAAFLKSEDAGKHWELVGDLGREAGVRIIQPAVVRLADGSLMAYMRSQEDYIYMSRSTGRGGSWSRARPTSLPNNNSGIDMVRLRSGNLVLVYNPTHLDTRPEGRDPGLPEEMPVGFDTWGPRTPLAAALSNNEGADWDHRILLEEGPGFFSYPAVIQGSDGTVHITYTYKRRSIRHIQITEEEILG